MLIIGCDYHRRSSSSSTSLRLFFGRQIVNKIDAGAVDAYKRWRREETKIRDVTLRHDLYSLSKFFRWAMARNYSRENPVKLVAIPSAAGAERVYVVSSAEERAYFQHARGALRDVPGIMLEQGCAPMEILSLRKADVDLETGTMKIRMTQISGKRPRACADDLPHAQHENHRKSFRMLQARAELEPAHRRFYRPLPYQLATAPPLAVRGRWGNPLRRGSRETLERETGFEPATSTLARSHSTTELLPHPLLPHPIRDFTALPAQGSIAIAARPERPTPVQPVDSKGTSRKNLAASSGGVGLM